MDRQKLIDILKDETKSDWHLDWLLRKELLGDSEWSNLSGPLGTKDSYILTKSVTK